MHGRLGLLAVSPPAVLVSSFFNAGVVIRWLKIVAFSSSWSMVMTAVNSEANTLFVNHRPAAALIAGIV